MKGKLRTGSYEDMALIEIALLRVDTEKEKGVLVFLPGEIFVRLGLKIRNNFRLDNILIVGHYDKRIGYVPDEFDFERGGYAATQVPRINGVFPFEKNVGEILVAETLQLIEDLDQGRHQNKHFP